MHKQGQMDIKEIHIHTVTKEEISGAARLVFSISVNGHKDELYYEVQEEYSEFLCDEVADGILVTLLPYAIRGGYDFVSEVPVSQTLYYRLKEQLIPQLALCKGAVHAPSIKAICINPAYRPNGVATAISCGVDSFTTLYEYTERCELSKHRLTHLTFFENGAHHKGQWGYDAAHDEVFAGQLAHVSKFCREFGYNLISVRSNLSKYIGDTFWQDSFHLTHTYRNVGFVLMLQKLIGIYYYSAAYDINHFACALDDDPANYECFLLPNLSTESTTFYNSNSTITRMNKIKMISAFPQTYDYLLTCYTSGENCGKCIKCIRTLIELDFLGVLDLYQNSYDVSSYKNERNWYLTRMYAKCHYDEFMMELVDYAKEHNIHIPLRCKIIGFIQGIGYGLYLHRPKRKKKTNR